MAGEVSRKVVVIRKKPPTAKVDLVEVAPAEHAVASHGSGPSITLICPFDGHLCSWRGAR